MLEESKKEGGSLLVSIDSELRKKLNQRCALEEKLEADVIREALEKYLLESFDKHEMRLSTFALMAQAFRWRHLLGVIDENVPTRFVLEFDPGQKHSSLEIYTPKLKAPEQK